MPIYYFTRGKYKSRYSYVFLRNFFPHKFWQDTGQIAEKRRESVERAKIEAELEDLVKKKFGMGGWQIYQGIMPQVIFTLPEARAVNERIEKLEAELAKLKERNGQEGQQEDSG